MGIIVIRKQNTDKIMSVKALKEKLDKETKYYGFNSGVMVQGSTEIGYRRQGKFFIAEVAPLSW